MMTTVAVELSGSLQALVDCRLDTIDRLLMGRMPRQDRLAIVREVEAQVFELLQERGREELSATTCWPCWRDWTRPKCTFLRRVETLSRSQRDGRQAHAPSIPAQARARRSAASLAWWCWRWSSSVRWNG